MDLFNKKAVRFLIGKNDKLTKQIQYLIDDLLSVQATESGYVGNNYRDYNSAVDEIRRKLDGTAEWGVLYTGNIAAVRSAFTIGKGLALVKKDQSADREMEWASEFLRVNDMYSALPIRFALEGECEGKVLLKLFYDEKLAYTFERKTKEGMIKIRHLSYQTNKYKIETNLEDYLDYIKVTGRNTITQKDWSLAKPDFVYRKFGGKISDPNTTSMKIWKVLSKIDDLDMALRDLRGINNLFATPVPAIKFDTAEEAKKAQDFFKSTGKNWKQQKMWFHTGEFHYYQPDVKSAESIEKEIVLLAKMISGTAGVPVHFLGFPDLMSNRSTAENLMELVWASMKDERETWESLYKEVLYKAMVMWNIQGKRTPLRPDMITVEIPEISSEEWKLLKDFWLPAFLGGTITLELFLSKIPGIDVEAELKRLKIVEQEKQKKQEKFIADHNMNPEDQDQENEENLKEENQKNNFNKKKKEK